MKKLETKNVILRKFEIRDAEKVYENWAGVEEIAEISDFKKHVNVEETRDIIKVGLGEEEDIDRYTWAIIMKETNEPVGFIRVYEASEINKVCKVTWTLAKKYWKKGISNEAIKEVIKYLFDEKEFNIIVYEYYTILNGIVEDILDDVGMKKEAVLKNRKLNLKTGEFMDKIIYSIFKENN